MSLLNNFSARHLIFSFGGIFNNRTMQNAISNFHSIKKNSCLVLEFIFKDKKIFWGSKTSIYTMSVLSAEI